MSQSALFDATAGRPAPATAGPTRSELHADVVAIPMSGGRVLRAARMDGRLIVANGYGDDDMLRALASGISLDVEAWPTLRRAVDELLGSP